MADALSKAPICVASIIQDKDKNEIAERQTLQLTDDEIKEQKSSDLVCNLVKSKLYREMIAVDVYGLTMIGAPPGLLIVLPPALWPEVFKRHHVSIQSGHLCFKHTFKRGVQFQTRSSPSQSRRPALATTWPTSILPHTTFMENNSTERGERQLSRRSATRTEPV